MTQSALTLHNSGVSRQLALSFPRTADAAAASLLPTAGTAAARQALSSGAPVILLYGAEGSGKTHLLRAWAEVEGAAFHTATCPPPPYPATLAVDDLDALPPEAQTQLFHYFNHMKQAGGRLVVASRLAVAQLPLLPDLKSRLLTGLAAEVTPPTAEELAQLALKWAAEHRLTLPPDVISYLLSRAERSAPALRTLIAQLDVLSLEQRRAVTIPLARQALQG